VRALRGRQQRNLLTTLFVSQGVPMLLAGDELGRSQQGNNNGYAQDNELSWVDWTQVDQDLLALCRQLVALRREVPALRRRRFLTGRPAPGAAHPDIVWFTPDGREMLDGDWGGATSVGMWLNGALAETDGRGNPVVGPSVLVLLHPVDGDVDWVLPSPEWGASWEVRVDTAVPGPAAPDGPGAGTVEGGGRRRVGGRSVVVLERPTSV
jgi:glycogen operon protein